MSELKMQDREKQIEEMAEVLRHSCENECFKNKDGFNDCEACEACLLYEHGYRKQSGWISVDERLPDIEPHGKGRYGGARSVRVLCACKQRDGRTFVKEGYYEPCGNGHVVWRIPGSIDSVTHWMPLPEPPKGE